MTRHLQQATRLSWSCDVEAGVVRKVVGQRPTATLGNMDNETYSSVIMRIIATLFVLLLNGINVNAQNKYFATIKSKNAFMTSVLYGGHSIELPKGANVELIDISESKIRVMYNNQIGYTYVDFLNLKELRLFETYYQNKMNNTVAYKKNQIQLALLAQDTKFDSIKSLYNDSSMLIIRPKKDIEAYVFDSPNRNIIADVTNKYVFKVVGASSYSFLKVTGINNKMDGYIYHPHFETTQALLDYIPILVKQKIIADSLTQNVINERNRLEDNERNKLIVEREREEATKKREKDAISKQKAERQKNNLILLYGKQIADKIIKHEYWVGMNSLQAFESLGRPQKINETVTTFGTTQQWVYSDKYLYFENDILTSYQKSY